jgi:hypothetical protein
MAPRSFVTEVLADGPIGYWRLGELLEPQVQPMPPGTQTTEPTAVEITLGQPGFHGDDTAALFDGKTGRVGCVLRLAESPYAPDTDSCRCIPRASTCSHDPGRIP